MQNDNVISVSWGDHLTFGEGDGVLGTPMAVARRMARWRDELSAGALHWRYLRAHLEGEFYAAKGYRHPTQKGAENIDWDDLKVVPALAHEAGLKAYLYVSLFDEGWPLPPEEVREVSYHNEMHRRHVSWQSNFSREHPEYAVVDREGLKRQWGVLCLAYPDVRKHFRKHFTKLLSGRNFDGLFVCLRSQSRPADFADQFGFNEPVRQEYLERYGVNINREGFDLKMWRELLGEYLTLFLRELRGDLKGSGVRLSVGVPRGDVLGPPLSNATLQWRQWVADGIVDELVINQNSSQCPSMWHQLWPMHRGAGYIQNHLTGHSLPPLTEHIASSYGPALDGKAADLMVARQWSERSVSQEAELLGLEKVKGMVFSSFRFDNPAALARGNWRA